MSYNFLVSLNTWLVFCPYVVYKVFSLWGIWKLGTCAFNLFLLKNYGNIWYIPSKRKKKKCTIQALKKKTASTNKLSPYSFPFHGFRYRHQPQSKSRWSSFWYTVRLELAQRDIKTPMSLTSLHVISEAFYDLTSSQERWGQSKEVFWERERDHIHRIFLTVYC